MAKSIIGHDQLFGIDFDKFLGAEEEMFPASCLPSDTWQQTSPAQSRSQLSCLTLTALISAEQGSPRSNLNNRDPIK